LPAPRVEAVERGVPSGRGRAARASCAGRARRDEASPR